MSSASDCRALLDAGRLDLPDPASGATSSRLGRLRDIARHDLSVARLAEAHVDAIAILHEAGRTPRPGLYGVWAAEDPARRVDLDDLDGTPVLDGVKPFCSGAGLVDRALVTAHHGGRRRLVDVDLRPRSSLTTSVDDWATVAFGDTSTGSVTFERHMVDDLIGGPDWYLDRVGFWQGACGPAACWAGGAMGLADQATRAAAARTDPHTSAQVGELHSLVWQLDAMLDHAGATIDGEATDRDVAMRVALSLRRRVERACLEIVDISTTVLGPRALGFDRSIVRRVAEVQLYVRQSHAERDLDMLGRALLDDEA